MAPRKRSWKSPDGSKQSAWMVDFVFKFPDGSTTRIRERSPINTKNGAIEFERLRKEALLKGPPPKQAPTFNEFVPDFLTEATNNNKASSVHSKRVLLNAHLQPFFGAMRLDEITAAKVETYKAEKLAAGLAAKSINNHLIVLKRALSIAVERELLTVAPKVKKLKLPPQSFEFLDFDEADRFVAATTPEWRTFVITALKTGLRLGELLELKWSDLDLVTGNVFVRRNIWRGIVDLPKGGRTREVPMSTDLVVALKAHRHLKGDYVFCYADGKPYTHDCRDIKRLARVVCKKAGLAKVITIHDWRHSFASHLVMRGVPLAAVSSYLGHADISTTMIYAHLSPTARREWVQMLDAPSVTKGKEEVK
jgi:integrase